MAIVECTSSGWDGTAQCALHKKEVESLPEAMYHSSTERHNYVKQ